jgi:hypothetical protein
MIGQEKPDKILHLKQNRHWNHKLSPIEQESAAQHEAHVQQATENAVL